ncbi:LysR substrate-binding domain-containing protein [Caproicibacterium sp. NSD3]
MTLRHMKIFVTVCRCKSATAAAEKLGIAQPAVSLAIKELEQYYGVSLFDRISHRLYITDEGKRLFEYACKIVLLFDEAESDIRDWDSFGILRIGSSITIGTCLLPNYVARFHSKYPKTKVLATIDNSAEIEKKILDNQLDFALIEGNVHSDSIVRYPFLKDELILVCGAKDKTFPYEVSVEQFGKLPFLLREKGSGTRELFDSTLLTKGITITPDWESISTEAIINAVSCGLGVSVLPLKLVEHDLSQKILKQIHIRDLTFERYFYLIHHKDKHLSKSILAFWELNDLRPYSKKKVPERN